MKLCLDVDWVKQRLCIQEAPEARARFRVTIDEITMEGENMATTMTDVQHADAAIKYQTAAGNPAKVDGVPVWASSDESAISVTPAADGFSARIDSVGGLGKFQVTVKADADMGEGVKELTSVLDIEVIASEAAQGAFEVAVYDNEPVEPEQPEA